MNNIFYTILQQSNVSTSAERYLLIYMIGVLIVITALVIIFFIVFQKRKNKLLLDKVEQQRKFDEELIKTQQEIQDATLKHIGRELHDNVGQLLSAASMQVNMLVAQAEDGMKSKLGDTAEVIKDSLTEVRALSKSLNSDVIYDQGFDATLANEIARLNKLNLLEADFEVIGDKVDFENKKDEVILFRILQEFFSNTIKYANADHLEVKITYHDNHMLIHAKDNGDGFDISNAEKGSGLINMENRAGLINTAITLDSKVGEGTSLFLNYPFNFAKD